MREFGKTPRKSLLEKLLAFFKRVFTASDDERLNSHQDRMQSRRRKTKFDRWGR